MARPRKNISEPRSETITISLSSAERDTIDAAARAAGMSRSAYAVTRILAPQRQGVFRTGRRQEMASALTDAARSLDEIVRGMDGAAPMSAIEARQMDQDDSLREISQALRQILGWMQGAA